MGEREGEVDTMGVLEGEGVGEAVTVGGDVGAGGLVGWPEGFEAWEGGSVLEGGELGSTALTPADVLGLEVNERDLVEVVEPELVVEEVGELVSKGVGREVCVVYRYREALLVRVPRVLGVPAVVAVPPPSPSPLVLELDG